MILRISKPLLGTWPQLAMQTHSFLHWVKQNLLIREALEAREYMELPRISINNNRGFHTRWNKCLLHHANSCHLSLNLSNRHKIFKVRFLVRADSKSSVMQILSNLIQNDSRPWYLLLTASLGALLFMMTKIKRKTIIKEEVSECRVISNWIVRDTTQKQFSSRILTTINSSSKIKIKRKKKTLGLSSLTCKEWI